MISLPKIGFRNIKTGLAVFVCLALFNTVGREDAFFACIASIICMGDSIKNTLAESRERIIGTVLGGILSIAFLYLVKYVPYIESNSPIIIAFGVSIIIYIANLLKVSEACSLCCIVYIGVMLNYNGSGAFSYVTNRTIDTLIGILIAIIINYSIKAPKIK